jgi:hypothetical protein
VDANSLRPLFAVGRVGERGAGAPPSHCILLSDVSECSYMPDYARGAGATCASGAKSARRDICVYGGSQSEAVRVTLFANKRTHVRTAIQIRLSDCYRLHERGAVGCFFSRRWARDIGAVDAILPLADSDAAASETKKSRLA